MTWEQKLMALKALCDTCLRMRAPGNWYVSALSREVKSGGCLLGEYGNGSTPESAVEDDWAKISDHSKVIVINAMSENRREVRWNGFMWEDSL